MKTTFIALAALMAVLSNLSGKQTTFRAGPVITDINYDALSKAIAESSEKKKKKKKKVDTSKLEDISKYLKSTRRPTTPQEVTIVYLVGKEQYENIFAHYRLRIGMRNFEREGYKTLLHADLINTKYKLLINERKK